MKVKKINSGYLIKLEKNEKLVQTLIKFCEEHRINSGWISGIGSLAEIELAYYRLDRKEYSHEKIEEPLEIVSLMGNIAFFENKHAVHAHIVASDAEMKTYAGHLQEAVISATCEIFLIDFDAKIERKHSPEIGLNLLDI